MQEDDSGNKVCSVDSYSYKSGLNIEKQVIAWGGDGAAFEVKDLFGIQD